MNSPVSSLLVGDRIVSRCDDGLLEAEYALFDRSEVLLSAGAREEGFMTRAGFARARLHQGLVTSDLAFEAYAAVRGRHVRALARSSAVRDVADDVGPYEAFQGARFVAARRRYTGLWLDLDALALQCPLRDAAILMQVLHLVLVLEEVGEDVPVRLLMGSTSGEAPGAGRGWRRVDLEPAQRLPWILREMRVPQREPDVATDEAEVREEILRDLRARPATSAAAQLHLSTLAAAIAHTGTTEPPPGMPELSPNTQRMSVGPPRAAEPGGPSAAPARPSHAPQGYATARGGPGMTTAFNLEAAPQDLRAIAQSLTAQAGRPPFVPDLAVRAARAWLAAGESGFARHFARLVLDNASASEDDRRIALEILDSTRNDHATARPPSVDGMTGDPGFGSMHPRPPMVPLFESQPAPAVVASAPPRAASQAPANMAIVRRIPTMPPVQGMDYVAPNAALALRARSTAPPSDPPFADPRSLDPRVVLLAEPDSERAASFRLLRDNLLAKKAFRLIAVSSGAPHEGKTTCAINLALALSEKPSTRVLLLEGNFFAPSLGNIFHIDATTRPDPQLNLPVLAPYRIVHVLRGFHVAALVQEIGEPAPTFNSRWFDMVIDHLSGASYDYLVIDAAALDGSPAVTQVLRAAEGTLLTARSHATTARNLRRAAEQIPEGRALGVTLMDSDAAG